MHAKKIALPWEHYARAPSGMWVRATRTADQIRLEWQVRTVVSRGRVQTLDANGGVERTEGIARAQWGSPWALAGALPLDDAFVAWSTVRHYDACAYGAMRHLAGLLAGGYGPAEADPEEEDAAAIVGWFRDLGALAWLAEGARYRLDREHAPLVGLVGAAGTLGWSEDCPVLYLAVGEREYPIRLDTAEAHRALLIAATVEPPEIEA